MPIRIRQRHPGEESGRDPAGSLTGATGMDKSNMFFRKNLLKHLQRREVTAGTLSNANRDVALAWKEAVIEPRTLHILPCEPRDLEQSWDYFRRPDLHKLSAVDATSFVIMRRARIRLAYTFDHHFAVVGFRMVT